MEKIEELKKMQMLRRLLRLEDVVEITGLSRAQVYKLMSKNQFPLQLKMPGRRVAWRAEDIDKWISELTSKAAA